MGPARSTETVRMKSQLRRRRAPGWLVAGLVFACVGWLSSPAAQAGCSHYVTTTADAARAGAADLDRLVTSGPSSEGPWRISPLERSPARSCSGFGCSRDSKPPMTASPALPRIDAWGRFDLSAFVLRTHSSPLPLDSDSPRPLDRADRLARPPRS
jgi:hypothetical protein